MTHRSDFTWYVLAFALVCGCSKGKPDAASMQPVSENGGGSQTVTAGDSWNQGGPSVDVPPIDWQVGETASPQFEAAPPEEDPSGKSYAMMAEPPEAMNASPVEEPVGSGMPLAPSTTIGPDEPSMAIAPNMGIRATGPIETDDRLVDVFYGTDRARLAPATPDLRDYLNHYRGACGLLAATFVIAGALVLGQRRKAAVTVAGLGTLLAAGLGMAATGEVVRSRQVARAELVQYGDGRGELELGVAQVSIPKDHRVGEVESPSLLRLEFHEDAKRHVSILEAKAYPTSEFYSLLQDKLARSTGREILVFVHGFNVDFDDAVRRTAQIAYDLKYPGAAVCYSWPSSGALLSYAADENNVQWTVPHLKQFLTQLREESGASAINLVAHSMGTRALTDALREFARESQAHDGAFNQVVLAAPDIDAEVFRRDIVPALMQTSRRVTLYASSNDEALMASRKLHAYPRAGESGSNLVVATGLDTIDVSAIDTSLLGHSYYGDNDSVISDLYHLVHDALPPAQRERLQAAAWNGLPYWVFTPITPHVATPDFSRATQ